MDTKYKYILEIYKQGSMSAAAKALFITQPALSIGLHEVEKETKMPIFDRSSRPLQPTAAGLAFIEAIKEIQYIEDNLHQHLTDIVNLETGTLRIGGTHYLNAYILPDFLTAFTKAHPKIEIELIEKSSGKLLEDLREHELDLVFNCDPEAINEFPHNPAFVDNILLAVPHDEKINKKLKSYALTAHDIAQKKHLEENCPSLSIKAFADLDFLLLKKGNNLYTRSKSIFKEAEVTPKIKMVLAQLVTAFHLAEHNMAATFISDRIVTGSHSNLCFYKLDSAFAVREFSILQPNKSYLSFPAKKFIEEFNSQFPPK